MDVVWGGTDSKMAAGGGVGAQACALPTDTLTPHKALSSFQPRGQFVVSFAEKCFFLNIIIFTVTGRPVVSYVQIGAPVLAGSPDFQSVPDFYCGKYSKHLKPVESV